MAMRQSWMLAAALLAAWGASAATLPCANATLAGYQTLTMGCTIDSTLFAGFSALASTGTPIDPATVQVTPVLIGNDRGFRFDFNRTAGANDALGILIGYTVSLTNAASLTLNGSVVTPDGANTGILNICAGDFDPGGAFGCTGASDFDIAFDIGVDAKLQASLGFPLSATDVFVDVVIDSGPTGSATLASATVLHTVPEPATWSVVLIGLACAGLRKATRNNKEDR